MSVECDRSPFSIADAGDAVCVARDAARYVFRAGGICSVANCNDESSLESVAVFGRGSVHYGEFHGRVNTDVLCCAVSLFFAAATGVTFSIGYCVNTSVALAVLHALKGTFCVDCVYV